ncbi:MAG: HAMP domain-containing histidine kinase [Labilithrix sp.]|nr:HAMP domain-containing histidine kinase [Labilithrix sp.]
MTEQHVPLHLEQTDITELLRVSLQPLVEQAARSRIDLHIATLGDVPRLRVDREKLAWSVTALVGNALRYVAHGETSGDVGGSILVHVTRESGADVASISIQDDGPGIPGDKVPFLFERRAGAVHADGLALSLVRQIVAAHAGRIDVETRREPDDHGTSITITLPIGG